MRPYSMNDGPVFNPSLNASYEIQKKMVGRSFISAVLRDVNLGNTSLCSSMGPLPTMPRTEHYVTIHRNRWMVWSHMSLLSLASIKQFRCKLIL